MSVQSTAATVLGILLVVSGVAGLVVTGGRRLERADSSSVLGWFTRPYRILDNRWLGGDRRRALRIIAATLFALGCLLLARAWLF